MTIVGMARACSDWLFARRYGLLAFIVPFAIYALTLNGIWSSDYQSSVLGLQYSLWANHSFSLGATGHPVVNSVDVGLFNGKYYSEISPGFALVSLPFAALGFLIDGNRFSVFGHALLMDELFLALTSSLAAFFVYKMCRLYSNPAPSLLASLTFALATPVWPFATIIFIQGSSVMFSTASVYLVLRHVKVTRKSRDLLLAGVCLGAAAFVEYMAALFILPLIAYVLIKGRGPKSAASLITAFSVGPVLWFVTNYLAFSDLLVFPEQLKAGPILAQFDFSQVIIHAGAYLVSPYRGLLIFSPVVILGLFMIYRMMDSTEYSADAILFLSLFILVLLGYSGWRDWAGGLGYGPRFLILGVPYLVVPISILLSKYGKVSRYAFFLLFIGGVLVEGIGTFTTAISAAGDYFTFQPYVLNIPWFIQGKFDTWWFGTLNIAGPLNFQLAAAGVFSLIIIYCFILCSMLPEVKSQMVTGNAQGKNII